MNQPRSAQILVSRLTDDPDTLEELKLNPVSTLKKYENQIIKENPRALEGDKWIYRIVVLALSSIAIASVIGAIVLASKAGPSTIANIPDVITALGSAAIGALAGLLAPSPKVSDG